MTVSPQTVTVVEGANITLTCNTNGIPFPLTQWMRIGQSGVVSQNSALTVVNVRRPGTPDNMIQYRCTASNGVDSPTSSVANVIVHRKYNPQPTSILCNLRWTHLVFMEHLDIPDVATTTCSIILAFEE